MGRNDFHLNFAFTKTALMTFFFFMHFKVLEAQMKADLADKENLEARRAQHEEESRENSKLISEQKAVKCY